jgi:hypothetical protein
MLRLQAARAFESATSNWREGRGKDYRGRMNAVAENAEKGMEVFAIVVFRR